MDLVVLLSYPVQPEIKLFFSIAFRLNLKSHTVIMKL